MEGALDGDDDDDGDWSGRARRFGTKMNQLFEASFRRDDPQSSTGTGTRRVEWGSQTRCESCSVWAFQKGWSVSP